MATKTPQFLTYFLSSNLTTICRICLEKSGKLTPIFDPVKPPHFSVLIQACAAVQVQENDGLPPSICQRCISRLNIAFQFKMQCESSDEKLRQCAEAGLAKEQKDNEQQHVSVEDEFEGANYFTRVVDCPVIKQEDSKHLVETDPLDDKLLELRLNPSLDEEKKSTKVHECNVCNKTFKAKAGLVHHMRIHTGERPYVCHLCPKRFVNGGHLHTHMKTHTGEKNHICSACMKAFATAQQLTKHTIAIHTSERPYACTFCPKRFASSSNLATHVKIHTGEKNFNCQMCGKTFSTKGQLQQHFVIHTGEKAFMCEHCNKRFSQKAHLTRHLRIHSRTD